jgi:hypothetical protein
MILIFEQDFQDHGRGRFDWRGSWFRGGWGDGRTWRIAWGLWSLSYYPAAGLRPFFDHVESGATEWRAKS